MEQNLGSVSLTTRVKKSLLLLSLCGPDPCFLAMGNTTKYQPLVCCIPDPIEDMLILQVPPTIAKIMASKDHLFTRPDTSYMMMKKALY